MYMSNVDVSNQNCVRPARAPRGRPRKDSHTFHMYQMPSNLHQLPTPTVPSSTQTIVPIDTFLDPVTQAIRHDSAQQLVMNQPACIPQCMNTPASLNNVVQPVVSVSSTTRPPSVPQKISVETQAVPEAFNKASQFDYRSKTMVNRSLNATVRMVDADCQTDPMKIGEVSAPKKIYVDRASSPINFPPVAVRRKFTAKRKDRPPSIHSDSSSTDIDIME